VKNSHYGIYGTKYPIALRNDIKVGPATILANIDGKKVEEYSIEIEKVSRKSANGLKGMIIRVTDDRLLEATGGIVQGMKLVGAVTHVLVNDPARGYGILIEWMIKNMADANLQNVEMANAS